METIQYQHQLLHQLVAKFKFRSLLDIGCGDGDKAIHFASSLGLHVTAIDEFEGHGSQVAYQSVKGKVVDHGLDGVIDVRKLDARELERLASSFDIAFAQNTFHHIFPSPASKSKEVEELFRKIYDKLTPGGILYICEAGRFNFWDWLSGIFPGDWYENSELFSTINRVDFKTKTPLRLWAKHLAEAGYEIIAKQYYVPYPFRKFKAILSNPLANAFLESNYILVALKPVERGS